MVKNRTMLLGGVLMIMLAVSGCGSTGKSMDMGGMGLVQELTGLIGKLTGSLGGITSLAGAEQALPTLQSLDTELGQLAGKASNATPEVQEELSKVAAGALPDINSLVGRVSGIPGVTDLLGSTMSSITGNLNGLL